MESGDTGESYSYKDSDKLAIVFAGLLCYNHLRLFIIAGRSARIPGGSVSRNRYVGDYRLVESIDERGRIRTDFEYIGATYVLSLIHI